MITVTPSERSLASITTDDLARLAWIARNEREDFFTRHPQYSVLADRLIAVTLCQGAALHFLGGHNGVKVFDVWTFYAAHPQVTYPARRKVFRDFGDPKFGQTPDSPEFVGRRVDLFGRCIEAEPTADPVTALRAYLTNSTTVSAYRLAQKAVVILEPASLLGTVVWPVQ